jgi:hypothetical protein
MGSDSAPEFLAFFEILTRLAARGRELRHRKAHPAGGGDGQGESGSCDGSAYSIVSEPPTGGNIDKEQNNKTRSPINNKSKNSKKGKN